ncbi:MAG TPA: GNAT family N-acetyltransferase [Coriobacteriia bacterium]|nr:GNAT family N-acetyltransferase [Coriobacteriia bacterium]
MQLFADAALSARLEALAASEMRRFVQTARALDAHSDATALEVAGGVAAYLGAGSPVNQAVGLGMCGRVSAEEAHALEAFYASRAQRGLAMVSPLADPSLLSVLAARGWTADSFENVLVREYLDAERFSGPEGVEVVEVVDDEMKAVWVQVAAIAFSAPLEPQPAQLELGRIVAARPHTCLLLALVDGRPAGTGELFIEDGVAWLSADATLPQFRRRGVQQAMQARRLQLGADAACEFAVSEALPGSGSQRNMERVGFRVAYTRVDVVAPFPVQAQ